jgi:hypothetical protein
MKQQYTANYAFKCMKASILRSTKIDLKYKVNGYIFVAKRMWRFLNIVLILALASSCATQKKMPVSDTSFEQRDGSSIGKAIVVNNVDEEYIWVDKHYPENQLISQKVVFFKNLPYDKLILKLKDGTDKAVYFDVSQFYGRDF